MGQKFELTRRDLMNYALAATAASMMPRYALAQQPNAAWAAVEAAAKKEGKVVLYYSGVPTPRAAGFLNAWAKRYPEIKLDFIEVAGSANISRIMQESLAGGPTCDVTTNTMGVVDGLIKQDLLSAINWKSYGMNPSKEAYPTPYTLATHAVSYAAMYNTKKVSAAELPKKAEDLLDKKWTGRCGTWSRPIGIVTLIGIWGEDKTTDYVKRLAETKPRLFSATAAWNDACTSGEVDMVHFIPGYTALGPIQAGAPVNITMLQPVPLTLVYGIVPKMGANPNAAKVLLAWLAGEGSIEIEKAIGRGNPFDQGSETAKQLKGFELSSFDSAFEAEKAEYLASLEDKFAKILQGR
ncbi:iron(III) transport system substrate-binding protein [Neorhizobium galegae]|uniref:ABC transporter substrate-binding protein n=1 Tax=Neorhizobium galegae TaxID=399 RepID=UPI0027867D7F|nr:hypothetical protein [Neorhizobium galegae]MDQ0137771.1 iron(III) transport system substrate-binding protein [Neorhizobium galegae]